MHDFLNQMCVASNKLYIKFLDDNQSVDLSNLKTEKVKKTDGRKQRSYVNFRGVAINSVN